jgi:glycine/D-amino acid oxidase-like deaminating enzyme
MPICGTINGEDGLLVLTGLGSRGTVTALFLADRLARAHTGC